MHAERSKSWSSCSTVFNTVVQKNNDDERGWRKIPNEREIFAGKEHCLEPWSGRSSETWVERYFELAKKDVSNLQEVATPGARDHQIFPEAFEMNGELSAVSAQMVLSSLYLERIGRPDLLWSVNTLSRPVPKWNKISDKSLLRLTSCIGQTTNDSLFCHVGNQLEDCQLVLFQDASFCRCFARFQIHVRRFLVSIWIAHDVSHLVDVQEANSSFSQRHRVRSYCARRRLTNRWLTSSSIMGVCVGKIVH